jgi:hypothetical protein
MPRSACNVALETYHGASTIILRIAIHCVMSAPRATTINRAAIVRFPSVFPSQSRSRQE